MSLFTRKPIDRILAESENGPTALRRTLGPVSLVALGIGAIIGAGLFSLTGVAAAQNAGPAVVLSMVIAAIGCALAGLCYSEFASMIPVAGSAYTYAYATLGEWMAWIVGWDLVFAYGMGAATVSISWSGYVDSLLRDFHITLPTQIVAGPFEHGIINLPALCIVVAMSLLLVVGIKESARINGIIVLIKLAIVVVFVGLGWPYIKAANYTPFIPPNHGQFGHFGLSGIMAGAGTIFLAYIGFDTVSTAAQEAKNPQRDVPIGTIGSLAVCAVLYVLFAVVLTGIVKYTQLDVAAPVAVAIDRTPYGWLRELVKFGIICGFTSVILVLLLGQSRIMFSMSHDGLVPKALSDIHERFRTPWRANLLAMLFVTPVSAFLPLSAVGQTATMGVLFAFVIVCFAVWFMRRTNPGVFRPFRTPWVPVVPVLGIVVNVSIMISLGAMNWLRLLIWLVIGQIIYFGYSRHHSRQAL